MSMYPNNRYMTKLTAKHFGPAPGGEVSLILRNDRFNRWVNPTIDKVLGAFPTGTNYPVAIVPPRTLGAISSRRAADFGITVAGLTIQMGMTRTGSTTLTLTVAGADGQLIVSASGSTTITLTVQNATLGSLVEIVGSTTITLTPNTPVLSALASLIGSTNILLTDNATLTGIGELAGHIYPYTTLSPENLAIAVWEAIASQHNNPGTMGELLNNSGAGGNPWVATLEGSYTAADLMRLMAAVLAGKSSGHPTSPVFRSVDDTADRVSGTLDANGNRTAVTVNP